MLRLACAITCGFVVVPTGGATDSTMSARSVGCLTGVEEIGGAAAAGFLRMAAPGSHPDGCARNHIDLGGSGTHTPEPRAVGPGAAVKTGPLVALSRVSGSIVPFPKVPNGSSVDVIEGDGHSGWYVGG